MARFNYGAGSSDFVFTPTNVTPYSSAPTKVPVLGGYTITLWSAQTGGSQYTDLILVGTGAVTSITANSNGGLPAFQGPSGVAQMWADAGGTRFLLLSSDAPKARQPINAAADYPATSAGVLAAFADAKAANCGVILPAGTYSVTGDLVLDWDDAAIYGPDGSQAVLNFTGGGLVIDGSTTFRNRTTLRNLRITRAGTAGPAIEYKGGGSTKGAIRWYASNVHVESSTGDGLKISGSYIGMFSGCYFRGAAAYGLNVVADTPTGTVFGNALTFVGCEIQGNVNAAFLDSVVGVTFVGGAIEGNSSTGVEMYRNGRAVPFLGVYFEQNGGYDIKVGTAASGGVGPVVTSCFFNDASVGKTQSILLIRGTSVRITDNQFAGFGANNPIVVNEGSPGNVTGYEENNTTNGSVPVCNTNGAVAFGRGHRVRANISTVFTGKALVGLDFAYTITSSNQFTMPTAVQNTGRYTIKNGFTANVSIASAGGTIDGKTTLVLAPGWAADLMSDDTNWLVVATYLVKSNALTTPGATGWSVLSGAPYVFPTTTATLAVNTWRFMPFDLQTTRTCIGLEVETSVAASGGTALGQFAIWDIAADGSPGALIADLSGVGTVDLTTAAGVKQLTGTMSQVISAGYIGFMWQGTATTAPTMQLQTGSDPRILTSGSSLRNLTGYTQATSTVPNPAVSSGVGTGVLVGFKR